MQAQDNQVALPLQSHTIFGVCEAIGEDFGFNPVLLRVPFAASVLWSPLWAIVAYLARKAMRERGERATPPPPRESNAPSGREAQNLEPEPSRNSETRA